MPETPAWSRRSLNCLDSWILLVEKLDHWGNGVTAAVRCDASVTVQIQQIDPGVQFRAVLPEQRAAPQQNPALSSPLLLAAHPSRKIVPELVTGHARSQG